MDKYFDVGLYTEYWGTVQLVSRLAEYKADIVALYMEVLSHSIGVFLTLLIL